MTPRPLPLHDRVVQAIARQAVGHVAYTNARDHPSACLVTGPWEVWPDVILCDQDTLLVQHVIEVETPESLSAAQVQRWAHVAHAVRDRGAFWLLVPDALIDRARHLCRQHGIRARVGVWSLTPQGVTVAWHRAPRTEAIAASPGPWSVPARRGG